MENQVTRNTKRSLSTRLPKFLENLIKKFQISLKNLVSYTENMDVFHGFAIHTRYLARYIVHVNFIKISPMKHHVRVNSKNGLFFKTFLVFSQYFLTLFGESGSARIQAKHISCNQYCVRILTIQSLQSSSCNFFLSLFCTIHPGCL